MIEGELLGSSFFLSHAEAQRRKGDRGGKEKSALHILSILIDTIRSETLIW